MASPDSEERHNLLGSVLPDVRPGGGEHACNKSEGCRTVSETQTGGYEGGSLETVLRKPLERGVGGLADQRRELLEQYRRIR